MLLSILLSFPFSIAKYEFIDEDWFPSSLDLIREVCRMLEVEAAAISKDGCALYPALELRHAPLDLLLQEVTTPLSGERQANKRPPAYSRSNSMESTSTCLKNKTAGKTAHDFQGCTALPRVVHTATVLQDVQRQEDGCFRSSLVRVFLTKINGSLPDGFLKFFEFLS